MNGNTYAVTATASYMAQSQLADIASEIIRRIQIKEQLKENTMGLQGYSTPTPHTVVFSTNYPDILKAIKAAGLAEHIMEGRGRYRGKEEVSYCCDKPVYDELIRRWPGLVAEQESILLLGTPKHCNWRPASLKYINGNLRGLIEDIGLWIEVANDEVRDSRVDYSVFNGKWFIVKKNPPIDYEEEKHREYTELLKRAFAPNPNSILRPDNGALLAQRAVMLGRRDKDGLTAVSDGSLHYKWVYK